MRSERGAAAKRSLLAPSVAATATSAAGMTTTLANKRCNKFHRDLYTVCVSSRPSRVCVCSSLHFSSVLFCSVLPCQVCT